MWKQRLRNSNKLGTVNQGFSGQNLGQRACHFNPGLNRGYAPAQLLEQMMVSIWQS
jgi:hypothetical protein